MQLKLILLLILVNLRLLAANDSTIYKYPRFNGPYIKSCVTDGRDLLLAPIHWKSGQWATFGLVAGSGILLYTQDGNIRDFWQNHQSVTATNLSKYVFEPWGSGKYTIPVVGAIYFAGVLAKNDRLTSATLTAGKAALLSGILIQITKRVTQRGRGVTGEQSIWYGPFAGTNNTSFPSGHTGFVFSVATVFASEYKETVWVPVLCYSLAAGTGLSRLYDDVHWASDVFIGAATGYVFGRFIWKHSQLKFKNLNVVPLLGNNMTGLSLILNINQLKVSGIMNGTQYK
jgi:membrane-associated phospholipid phosphatase